jgi:RimJ/RimL family protein N-acetyltransferase
VRYFLSGDFDQLVGCGYCPSMSELRLSTQRLILRPYRIEDWERVHIYGSDPDFSKYEIWGPNSIEDTKSFISRMIEEATRPNRFVFDFAVCLKDGDLLIGGCGIRRETEQSSVAFLGWAINPQFQSQGYATEAARELIRFGFEELNVSVIYATCDTRNAASYRVMEKLGMRKVGFIKGQKEVKGHLRDSFRYEFKR